MFHYPPTFLAYDIYGHHHINQSLSPSKPRIFSQTPPNPNETQILNPQSALLTNHEVLLHLLTEQQEYEKKPGSEGPHRKPPAGLAHTLRDGLAYLQTPEYSTLALSTAHPDRPMTLYKGPHSLFRAIAPKYRLNKAEYLQIYNLRPKNQAELELVVEEAGSRFTEDELYDILEIIAGVFDEEEASIPAGVENQQMEKIPNKLLGARKAKRKAVKRM